jgi:thiamine pyrophosphate-dependent acetolactate synthase large subunit-like protein
MNFTGNLRAFYSLDRYREALREAERRRLWTGAGLRKAKARDVVRRASERLGRWYAREGELCLNLEPACEMP